MSLNYLKSGVNIDAGNALVDAIKPLARLTQRAGVMDEIGGFGSAFKLPNNYTQPILISATDGVGTKLRLAIDTNKHDTIGIDLVAMCVNDLITSGAEPLFFLDYFATGKLNTDQAIRVIKGISVGCQQANCALIGGETAEMPGMYQSDCYDLAGFCVGAVEEKRMLSGKLIQPGQQLIGLQSSGVHSNGFSLVREVLKLTDKVETIELDDGKPLIQSLLEPTVIYVNQLLKLIEQLPVYGLAHITGGGIVENLPRILPNYCQAAIDPLAWKKPKVFEWLQKQGKIADNEMWRVFNQGIGMIAVVNREDSQQALTLLKNHHALIIGEIQERAGGDAIKFI